jgi:hypothetical protein
VNYKYTYYSVHRLVASHFISNPPSLFDIEIDHIDGDKLNNSFTNLRWVNHSTNMSNPVTTIVLKKRKGPLLGRLGAKHPCSKPIFAINEDGERLDFEGSRDADRKGYNFHRVQSCLHGHSKSYKGYQWFYNIDSQKMGMPFATQLM